MITPRTLAAAIMAWALLVACTSPTDPQGSSWSQWQRVPNAYAHRFEVWKKDGQTLVLVFGHGGLQDTVGCYAIDSPNAEAGPTPRPSVQLPRLDAIALTSTTHAPFVTALGQVERIVACAHLDQIRDAQLLQRVSAGAVHEMATGDGLDRETLITLKPQALFGYPFGEGQSGSITGLGIPVIEVSEYLEEHPLGKAEWLRFFGVLFGEERRADSLFAGIKERYETVRAEPFLEARPTVLFGSVWDGQWWVPPGNSYMARLIEDAGGRYLFADKEGQGNIAIDMETMVAKASTVDHWGMIAQVDHEPSSVDLTNGDARLEGFRAVIEQQLFIGNTRVADLFGQAALEPDQILVDLRDCLWANGVQRNKGRQPYFAPVRKSRADISTTPR
jgi:iron complex transport system substrate-binding protein